MSTHKATFNPRITSYLYWYVAVVLLVTIIGIPLMFVWLLGFGQYYSKRYYDHLECNLTDRHIQFRKGVMFKVEKTIPLENIQDLTFIQNPFLNAFDLRILKIETAGSGNPQGSDMQLIGIENMEHFKDLVMSQREVRQGRSEISQSTERPALQSDAEVVELLREIRDLLRK
jgi:putative membrane protein